MTGSEAHSLSKYLLTSPGSEAIETFTSGTYYSRICQETKILSPFYFMRNGILSSDSLYKVKDSEKGC